jgi:hypothetical protein
LRGSTSKVRVAFGGVLSEGARPGRTGRWRAGGAAPPRASVPGGGTARRNRAAPAFVRPSRGVETFPLVAPDRVCRHGRGRLLSPGPRARRRRRGGRHPAAPGGQRGGGLPAVARAAGSSMSWCARPGGTPSWARRSDARMHDGACRQRRRQRLALEAASEPTTSEIASGEPTGGVLSEVPQPARPT